MLSAMPVELNKHYGRLFTVCKLPNSRWLCACSCGQMFRRVRGDNLLTGNTQSCGCSRSKLAGLSNTPTYKSWAAMRRRCNDPKHPYFRDYGGRGITVCVQWDDPVTGFNQFVSDCGMRPHGLTLDRINNNLGYFPDNTRWATLQEQRWNRRDVHAKAVQQVDAEHAAWDEIEAAAVTMQPEPDSGDSLEFLLRRSIAEAQKRKGETAKG